VKLLHQEVAEQQEALEALRRTVERLRQPPAVPPPAKRAPAKAPPPAKAPAPARAAASAKTPTPTKRAPRAKKA
jgi:hypothetical protein